VKLYTSGETPLKRLLWKGFYTDGRLQKMLLVLAEYLVWFDLRKLRGILEYEDV